MRTNLILALVAAGLAVPTVLTISRERVLFTDFAEIPKLFPGFTPANVHAISVSAPKLNEDGKPVVDEAGVVQRDELQFVKQDGKWFLANTDIAGASVREDRIRENVLDHLDQLRHDQKALVQANADEATLEACELTEATGKLVRAFDSARNVLAELFIGKDASGGRVGEQVVNGFYVRRRDSADVALYEQTYWQVSTDREVWVARNLLWFDVNQAVEVSLTNPRGTMVFGRPGATGDWKKMQGPDGVGAVRYAEVSSFVQTLSFVSIQSHVQRLPPAGPQRDAVLKQHDLLEPKISASVRLVDGKEHGIQLGKQVPGKNEYYLRVLGNEFVYTIGDWAVGAFEQDSGAFFDPPADAVPKKDPPKSGDDGK
jgi:hypothetical protein